MTDDILRKIRGLLAKATGTDNEVEATTFFEAAQRLMSKYQISEAELVASGARSFEGVDSRIVPFPRCAAWDWKVHLLSSIADLHRGRAFAIRPRNNTSKHAARAGAVQLVGGVNDMALVEMLWTSLCLQLDMSTERYVRAERGRGVPGTALRASFVIGWVERVCARLEALYGEAEPEAGSGVALVLRDKRLAADDYVGQNLVVKSNTRTVRVIPGSIQHGEHEGNRADIGEARLASGHSGELTS